MSQERCGILRKVRCHGEGVLFLQDCGVMVKVWCGVMVNVCCHVEGVMAKM